MKQFIKTSVVGVIAALGGFYLNCHAETLEEIYQLALENDHTYKAAKARLAADKEAKNLARAGLLPRINGSFSLTESETERSGQQVGFQVIPSSSGDTDNTDASTTNYAITLEQPIIDFSAWNDFKAGAFSAKTAALEFAIAEQSLIIRAATAYFDVLEAYDRLQTALAEEKAFKQQLEQSQKRFEVGLTAITEVHESQAAYDSAVAGRLSAEGLYSIAFENLEVITGKQIESLSPLKENFPVVLPDPLDRKEWVKFSLSNNLNLKISSLNAKSAKATAKARKADLYPVVTGNLSYSNSNDDGDFNGDPFENDTEVTSFGVTVTVPLYNGGSRWASRRQANQASIQAEEIYLQTQRDTVQNARSVHLNVVTGVATVKARKQATTSNQSALDATQSGYEVGTRDLVDVLNAQRNLFAAQRDYQEALYDYILFTLNQKEVAGTLESKHISELNQWLDSAKSIKYSF